MLNFIAFAILLPLAFSHGSGSATAQHTDCSANSFPPSVRPVLSAANWQLGRWVGYFWVDDHRLFTYSTQARGKKATFIEIDLRSGEVTPLRNLTRLFSRLRDDPESVLDLALSPNHTLLLWRSNDTTVRIASLDGELVSTCPVDAMGQVAWFGIGNEWIEFRRDTDRYLRAIVRKADSTQSIVQYDLVQSTPLNMGTPSIAGRGHVFVDTLEDTGTEANFYRIVRHTGMPGVWHEISLSTGGIDNRTHASHGPADMVPKFIQDEAISPDGRRRALIWESPPWWDRPKNTKAKPSNDLLNIDNLGTPSYASIWISNLDGSGMRMVGRFGLKLAPTVECLHWLPDGKSLSVIVKGKLCLLALDHRQTGSQRKAAKK